jgi:hypothetical protein
VKRYEQYGRNPSWIVKWYRKYGRNASWNVKRYGKYGRFLLVIITHKETTSPPYASLLLLLPHAVLILLLRRRRLPPPPPSMPPTSFPIRVAYGHVTSGDVTPVTWLPIAPHCSPQMRLCILLSTTCFSNHFYLHFLLHAIHVAHTFY